MGSTGEPERKRRHFNNISAAVSSPAKKSSLSPRSEDHKLDAVVLQYQNQKLFQQLEAQKVEYFSLENKLDHLKGKQENYDRTLEVVDNSWRQLVEDLESTSVRTRGTLNDGASPPAKGDFLCRLLESGATRCCSDMSSTQIEDGTQATRKNILQNVVSAINDLWNLNNVLSAVLLRSLPEEPTRQLRKTAHDFQSEVKSLRDALLDLHLKHRPLANQLQVQRDTKAKNLGEEKHLAGELESTNADVEESKTQLAVLKAQRDVGPGAPYLFPSLGNNHVVGDKVRDKEKELQDLEFANKELMNLASNRLLDIRRLHEERIETLKRLSKLQATLSDTHCISSSKAFHFLGEQFEKSKAEINQCQESLEELQVEKDNFVWREKEVLIRLDLADISRKAMAISHSRIVELENLLEKLTNEKISLQNKLQEASGEPGRSEIIAEFKALVSSLPKDIDTMQSEMSKYKEDSSELHSLRAEVRSLTDILNRKKNELDALTSRSTDQLCDIDRLQGMVRDLKESEQELKLFVEMHKRESTDSSCRDLMECRDLEYKAWAHVQSLQSSLNEHSLELRVKAANKAEAISQQKLATAEAEIADLRQKLEASRRDMIKLSEVLKSKREEGEAYLSEIESIGQAYEDVQNKNQHLLQQITERDDYNIKLALESMKTRQVQDDMQMEIQTINWEVQQASSSLDVYSQSFTKLDDQLRNWSEQVGQLVEESWQSSVALENTKRRLLDVERKSQQLRKSLSEMQAHVDRSRLDVSELQIELEKERFNKKRVEEDLEIVTSKASCLRAHTEGLTVLGKLQQELGEYRGILKCGNCHDRQKEVVIAKCYHLFCNPCIRKTLESRHRKCPACATSFGPNDVKPIYI